MESSSKCKCYNCHLESEWQEYYILAVKRFDSNLHKATTITMVSVIVMLLCIIITAATVMHVIKFINDFECVVETTYSIEQDSEGINTALIGGESNEVKIYGAEDNRN